MCFCCFFTPLHLRTIELECRELTQEIVPREAGYEELFLEFYAEEFGLNPSEQCEAVKRVFKGKKFFKIKINNLDKYSSFYIPTVKIIKGICACYLIVFEPCFD